MVKLLHRSIVRISQILAVYIKILLPSLCVTTCHNAFLAQCKCTERHWIVAFGHRRWHCYFSTELLIISRWTWISLTCTNWGDAINLRRCNYYKRWICVKGQKHYTAARVFGRYTLFIIITKCSAWRRDRSFDMTCLSTSSSVSLEWPVSFFGIFELDSSSCKMWGYLRLPSLCRVIGCFFYEWLQSKLAFLRRIVVGIILCSSAILHFILARTLYYLYPSSASNFIASSAFHFSIF